MTDTDFASCCLLSYNRPEFLWTAVSTLRECAGAQLELIIHDDGSSDPAVHELLHRWVQEGVISTVILNPPGHNQGQGVALNRMFSMAKGDPIIKLDHDLIFEPNWLYTVKMLLETNLGVDREPTIGLLGLFHYWLDPCDSMKTRIQQFEGWSSRTHILGSAFAVRREVWNKLGPFEEHSEAFAEDWAFQQLVTESHDYVCGLPDQDLVRNQGFGVGPSTVVVAHDGIEGTVQTIEKGPLLHGG